MPKVVNKINQAILEITQAVSESLQETAEVIRDDAKVLVPVRTGELRDSIDIAKIDDQAYQIGTPLERGIFIEAGTSRMAAQPFLTPAAAQNSDTFEKILRRKLRGK